MPSAVLPNPGEELTGTVAALDDSALGQCWNGTWSVLEANGVMPAEQLIIRRTPALRKDDPTPCTMISHYGIRVENSAGTNNETALHYLFLLSFLWAEGLTAINGEGAALAAFERACVLFSKRPTSAMGFSINAGGACLRDCKIDAAQSLNDVALRHGILAKFLIVDYFVRLPYREGL